MYTIFQNAPKYSGNRKTLNRLSKLLNLEKTKYLLDNIIAINAYKFGLVRKQQDINYIIIVSGTDINFEKNKDPEKYKIVLNTLQNAKYIVVFSPYMYDIIDKNYNLNMSKVHIIPQSIPKKLKSSNYNLRERLPIKNKKIFLSVGNLRNVKRPDYLFDFFKKSKKYVYIIIGNILEGTYDFPNNVYHIGGLRQRDIYACIKSADALINTSISEGMSVSILEAMKLKCPVYAYRNKGNLSIVKDGFTGYIFDDLRSFKFIIKLPTKKIINNAYDYVYVKHSTKMECYNYLKLLDHVI
tara:strand:+ start:101 stop:991 length:891 start_codon:yes stop_codon:yes gene_type:complete